MQDTKFVKASVSMPQSLWDFIKRESDKAGHGMASRTIQKAVADFMARENRRGAKSPATLASR